MIRRPSFGFGDEKQPTAAPAGTEGAVHPPPQRPDNYSTADGPRNRRVPQPKANNPRSLPGGVVINHEKLKFRGPKKRKNCAKFPLFHRRPGFNRTTQSAAALLLAVPSKVYLNRAITGKVWSVRSTFCPRGRSFTRGSERSCGWIAVC